MRQVVNNGAVTRFSRYLADALEHYQVSAHDLAAALGYGRAERPDASVIYRWLRDEQVPRYGSPHVQTIAEYLHLTSSEYEQLKRAHLASLDDPPQRPQRRSRQRRPVARGAVSAVERLLLQTAPSSPTVTGQVAGVQLRPSAFQGAATPMEAGRFAHLASERRHVLELAIQFLERIPAPPILSRNNSSRSSTDDDTRAQILLTTQGRDAFEGMPELAVRWKQAQRQALHMGWRICHLLRLDRDVERAASLVETMATLVRIGGYTPRYFDRYGTLMPPYDLFVIPGVAAMVLFAAQNPYFADTAFSIRDPDQIERLSGHFQQLLPHTRPLIRTYFVESEELSFTKAVVQAEAGPGGRLLLKNGPSALTTPPWWYITSPTSPWINKVRAAEVDEYVACLRQRVQQFERHVQTHAYLDICPKRALRRLVETGEYPWDDPHSAAIVPREARLEHLRHLIDLLQRYPQYHIALLDEAEEGSSEDGLVPTESTWEVAGERHVFLESWIPQATGQLVQANLLITEPMIAQAFREYFTQLWEHRIADQNKEKQYVIEWLLRLAQYLEQHLHL